MLEAFLSGLLMAVLGFALSSVPFPEQALTFSQPLLVTSAECLLEFRSFVDPVPLAQNLKYLGIFAGHAEAQRTVRQVNFADHPPSQIERGNISESYRAAVKLSPDCSESRTALKSQQSSVTHTKSHKDCPACQQARIKSVRSIIPEQTTFSQAAAMWLDSRKFAGTGIHRFIAPRTLRDEAEFSRALNSFFSELPLNQIHLGHLRTYQEQRASGLLSKESKRWAERGHGAGPQKINQELGLLIRIMKRADCWTEEMQACYEPFQQIEQDIPRALSPIEQDRFLTVASSRPEWELVYLYSLVNLRIAFSNQEMRGIRLGDFNLQSAVITVQAAHAKRRNRIRTVPLTPDSLWALERLKARALELGSSEPQHYLFPFRVAKNQFDPNKPMTNSGIKKPWEAVRDAAGLPWFRQHDPRHTCITRWAESGMPIVIIMSMAGHLTQKMVLHYSHISEQAARLAMNQVYSRSQKPPQSAQWKTRTAANG